MSQRVEVIDKQSPAKPENRLSTLLPELPSYIETALLNLSNDTGFRQKLLTKEEKGTFCRVYAMTSSLEKSAEHIGISVPTAYRHLRNDPAFQDAFALAKLSMLDNMQATSVRVGLMEKGVVDRMCQLKRLAPAVYRELRGNITVGVQLNMASDGA